MFGYYVLYESFLSQLFVGFGYLMLLVYCLAMFFVTAYCIMQFHLLRLYKKSHRENPNILYKKSDKKDNNLPFVTIQLPMYNELYVAERIIDCVAEQDYPLNRFEIQVLDDSTDETVEIVAKKVAELVIQGIDIKHIHRKNRQGYKAGALQDAMSVVRGEFIAIFDADFMPRIDFLRTTIPYFDNPKVGTVQTRWDHLNAEYSLLTRLQALQLNVHFTVEQAGRAYGNLLLQFNGTAGVWRKKAIQEAGGWQSDTLTEDLDLSFRAQIKGYKIEYLEGFESPAELPVEMNGLKGQQFRWNKGGAENARKLLKLVWSADSLTLSQRVFATSQLFAYGIFLWVFLAAISSLPLAFMFNALHIKAHFLSFSLIGLFSIVLIYYTANVEAVLHRSPNISIRERIRFAGLFLTFLPISMGLSLYNAIAVLEGYMGKKSSFVRTPKYGITGKPKAMHPINRMAYVAQKISWITVGEGFLAVVFSLAFLAGYYTGNYVFLVFHAMLAFGFGTIFYFSVKDLKTN